MESGEIEPEDEAVPSATRRILYLAATISTAFGCLYFVGLAGKFLVDGTIHSASSPPIQRVSAAIGLLWDLALLIVFVALRRKTTRRNGIWAELGLAFMALVCATSSINWFVQLTLVPRLTPSGEPALLALLDIHRQDSLMYAVEHLAWGVFYGLATIFMGLAMEEGRLETWIRWLFVVGGALSLLHVAGIVIASPALIDLGVFAAGVLLPLTTALLAVRFRNE